MIDETYSLRYKLTHLETLTTLAMKENRRKFVRSVAQKDSSMCVSVNRLGAQGDPCTKSIF
jgi:hypothetical protein